jgi:L-asparaginase
MTIHIFTTGGSIDKIYSTQVSDFVVGAPHIAILIQDANVNLAYEVTELFRKDSLHITDEDRRLLVEQVAYSPHQHIIITHGTDTMTRTGEALRAVPDKTIIITGAMQPAAFKKTDAALNIGCALAGVQILPSGVYIAMSGRIFAADKTRKNPQTDQFETL